MANISVYDPFGTRLGKLFNNFFWHPALLGEQGNLDIRLDVAEDEKQYTVHADIPGVSKDDIHIDVDGNRVSISAEVKRQKEEKKKGELVLSERYEGRVSRSFSLGFEVDAAQAQAKYVDGVLELTLPKKEASGGKRIAIG